MPKPLYLALSPDSYKNIIAAFPELETHTLVISADFSVGPLSLDYSRRINNDIPYGNSNDAIRCTKKAWETLAQCGREIVVWYGNCPAETCALMATVQKLKDINVPIALRVPFKNFDSFVSLCEHPPEDIREMNFHDHVLDLGEQEQFAVKWKRLVKENAALRVNKNGMLVSVFDTYFDGILSRNDDIASALYEIRFQYGYYFNWGYLSWRKSILSQ